MPRGELTLCPSVHGPRAAAHNQDFLATTGNRKAERHFDIANVAALKSRENGQRAATVLPSRFLKSNGHANVDGCSTQGFRVYGNISASTTMGVFSAPGM
jgi:hypothetical protein